MYNQIFQALVRYGEKILFIKKTAYIHLKKYNIKSAHLHQTPLQITSLGCFHSRIDQTLTSSHCVKEKFGRRQTRVEAILHETTCCRYGGCFLKIIIIYNSKKLKNKTKKISTFFTLTEFLEMRQSTILKSIWHTLAIDSLLTDASNHL